MTFYALIIAEGIRLPGGLNSNKFTYPRLDISNEEPSATAVDPVYPALVCFGSDLLSMTAHDVYDAHGALSSVAAQCVGILNGIQQTQMVLCVQPRSVAEGMLFVLEGVTC